MLCSDEGCTDSAAWYDEEQKKRKYSFLWLMLLGTWKQKSYKLNLLYYYLVCWCEAVHDTLPGLLGSGRYSDVIAKAEATRGECSMEQTTVLWMTRFFIDTRICVWMDCVMGIMEKGNSKSCSVILFGGYIICHLVWDGGEIGWC